MELLVNMIRQIIGSIIGTVRIVESGHGGTYLKHSQIGQNPPILSVSEVGQKSTEMGLGLGFTCEMDVWQILRVRLLWLLCPWFLWLNMEHHFSVFEYMLLRSLKYLVSLNVICTTWRTILKILILFHFRISRSFNFRKISPIKSLISTCHLRHRIYFRISRLSDYSTWRSFSFTFIRFSRFISKFDNFTIISSNNSRARFVSTTYCRIWIALSCGSAGWTTWWSGIIFMKLIKLNYW